MNEIRSQFPILDTLIKNKPLVYLDNAATTQKPKAVIDSINHYYSHQNSNVHRGAHFLANLATEKFEESRIKVSNFIGAEIDETIFTGGTTHSINLLANAWGRKFLKKGDEIVLSEMEHHANLIPWLNLQNEIGFQIRYLTMNANCEFDLTHLDEIINRRTRLVSIAMVSNAIGTVHPVDTIIAKAKSMAALIHLDAAQAIQHREINVKQLDIDFMSFSSHKMYGPMGIGIFWGRKEHLDQMNPMFFGGEMIKEVFLDRFTLNTIPFKFEAGTPNVSGAIGLGTAIDFINQIGLETIKSIEEELHTYFYQRLKTIENIKLFTPQKSSSVLSFEIEGIHSYDIGQLLDSHGIAIRTGHHCCQPLMRKLNIEGTCRASISFYNTKEEIDFFSEKLKEIISLLKN